MESGKVLAVNSMARIEHVEIDWRISIKVLRNSRSISNKTAYLGRNSSPRLSPPEKRAS